MTKSDFDLICLTVSTRRLTPWSTTALPREPPLLLRALSAREMISVLLRDCDPSVFFKPNSGLGRAIFGNTALAAFAPSRERGQLQ
jgi:hypothetical protein